MMADRIEHAGSVAEADCLMTAYIGVSRLLDPPSVRGITLQRASPHLPMGECFVLPSVPRTADADNRDSHDCGSIRPGNSHITPRAAKKQSWGSTGIR